MLTSINQFAPLSHAGHLTAQLLLLLIALCCALAAAGCNCVAALSQEYIRHCNIAASAQSLTCPKRSVRVVRFCDITPNASASRHLHQPLISACRVRAGLCLGQLSLLLLPQQIQSGVGLALRARNACKFWHGVAAMHMQAVACRTRRHEAHRRAVPRLHYSP